MIPRGTTHRWEPADGAEQHWLCFHTPGEIETPNRYRNRYGQLLEHAPYSQRDFHPPGRARDGRRDRRVRRSPCASATACRTTCSTATRSTSSAGTATSTRTRSTPTDFEPRAGRFHLPPPAHQTFQGPNFVICTFAPRMLDWDETAVPLPYHHSNIQSEEVMFYADGDYAARKGVDVGCLTLHPSRPAARPAARARSRRRSARSAPTSSR